MSNKITFKDAQDCFREHGCELLEDVYTNAVTPMRYRCSCGRESHIRLSCLKRGQRCKFCRGDRNPGAHNVLTFEDLKQYFTEQGCVLLETQYNDPKQAVRFTCSCGHESSTLVGNFRAGRRCLNCRSARRLATRRRSLEEVAAILAEDRYVLLSTEYKNTRTPLAFRCPRGHEHTIMLSNWMKGYRCRKCYLEDNVGENHPNWVVDRDEKARLDSLRNRYYSMLHSVINSAGLKKQGKAEKLLGYDWKTLYAHLRAFPEWCTLQKGRWHIDHIFPIDCFIKAGITDPAIINALDNLRPITGKENCSKGNRYNHREFERYLKRKNISPPKSVQETL